MGWTEYIINEEKKVAYQISRHTDDLNEDEDLMKNLNNIFYYLCEEETKSAKVIEYLFDKLNYIADGEDLFIKMLYNKGFNQRVHEDKLPKDYIIIN